MSDPSPPVSITAAIARWVLGHRRLAIGLIALATVLSIVGATRIGLSFSSRDFFATSDDGAQAAADLEALIQRWGPDDATLLVLAEADDVTTVERIAALSRLSDALADLPTVVRTVSIADVPASVLRAPPVVPALVSEGGDATIVAVQLSASSDDLGAVVPIVDAVTEIVERHQGEAGLSLTPAGVVAVRAAFFSLAIRDQAMLGPLVSLAVAVVLFVAFRRRHAVVVPMLAAGLPLVWLLGSMGASGEPIGLLNQAFFTLLPVIAIADAVHWVVRVHDEWRAAPDDRDGGIVRAGAGVGMACTLTSLTTAAGFLTLVAVDVEILRRFGTWAAIGIGLAWISVVVVVPLALSLVRAEPSEPGAGRSRAVARWSMEHPAIVSVLAVGLLAAAGQAGQRLVVDNRLTDLLPVEHPVRRASDRIDDDLGGILALEVELAGAGDTELAALADWARTQPEVRWVGAGQAAGAAWQRQDGIARISIHTADVGGRAFAGLAERVEQRSAEIDNATVVVTGTPLVAYTGGQPDRDATADEPRRAPARGDGGCRPGAAVGPARHRRGAGQRAAAARRWREPGVARADPRSTRRGDRGGGAGDRGGRHPAPDGADPGGAPGRPERGRGGADGGRAQRSGAGGDDGCARGRAVGAAAVVVSAAAVARWARHDHRRDRTGRRPDPAAGPAGVHVEAAMRRLLAISCLGLAGCATRPPPAQVVILGALQTMDDAQPEAEGLAIADGALVAVGSREAVLRYEGPDTVVVDVGNATVLPGFVDGHVHPVTGGIELGQCDLNGLETASAVADAIRACAERPADSEWIVGGGWDLTLYPDAHPTAAQLDAIVADRPVYLTAADAHSAWVNTLGLQRAGIDAGTPDPADGRIERDGQGDPTGTLREGGDEARREAPAGADRCGPRRGAAARARDGPGLRDHVAPGSQRRRTVCSRRTRPSRDRDALTARVVVGRSTWTPSAVRSSSRPSRSGAMPSTTRACGRPRSSCSPTG